MFISLTDISKVQPLLLFPFGFSVPLRSLLQNVYIAFAQIIPIPVGILPWPWKSFLSRWLI